MLFKIKSTLFHKFSTDFCTLGIRRKQNYPRLHCRHANSNTPAEPAKKRESSWRDVVVSKTTPSVIQELKLVMLLALLSGQRCQTLHCLNIKDMILGDSKCVFLLTSVLKTSAPNRHLTHIEFLAYPLDTRLCVINCLKTCLTRTRPRRGGTLPLFLSFQKPFKPVARDTIARWLKSV